MLPFDKKSLEKLKKLEEQLSPTEKALLAAHIALYDTKEAFDKLGENKNIQAVRDDVLLGNEKFKGFMFYLEKAQKGLPVLDDVIYFLDSQKRKLARFQEAFKIVTDDKNKITKIWISKEDGKFVYKEPKRTDEDGNEVENTEEYWWVTSKSTKLIDYITAEVAFGEAVAVIIRKNQELAPGRTQEIEEDKALREGIDLLDEAIDKTKETETDLDEIVIEGITTTIDLHKKLLSHKKFIDSNFNVAWLDKEKII